MLDGLGRTIPHKKSAPPRLSRPAPQLGALRTGRTTAEHNPLIHPYLCSCNRSAHSAGQCKMESLQIVDLDNHLPYGTKIRRMLRHALAYSKKENFHRHHPKDAIVLGNQVMDCAMPLCRQKQLEVLATRIQSCWRRYQAELEKEMKHFQLLQLEKTSRPFVWRQMMQRVATCFFSWRELVRHPRHRNAAIAIQTFRRCHAARHKYESLIQNIATLSQKVNIRLKRNQFVTWYRNARWLRCLRAKSVNLKYWRNIVKSRRLCRKVMLKMWQVSRVQWLKLGWGKMWDYVLWERRFEWESRLGIVLVRWKKIVDESLRWKRRSKKTVIIYWRALSALKIMRRKRYMASTLIASTFRGWLFRTHIFRSARVIQCAIRQRLARNTRRAAYTWRLFLHAFYAWKRAAPDWKRRRIKREKRRLYRAAVKRRMLRRADKGLGSSLSPSWEDVVIGMEGLIKNKKREKSKPMMKGRLV